MADLVKRVSKKWWTDGIRFQCQGSGKCCLSRGQYGFVYMTLSDRQKMAKVLKLDTRSFTHQYCEKDSNGYYRLKSDKKEVNCIFLKDKRCTVYEGRPTQCRTWPFWPEVMGAKTWAKEVSAFCPGVGKGPVIPVEVIKARIEEQKRSEEKL